MPKIDYLIDISIKRGLGSTLSKTWLKTIIKAVLLTEKVNTNVAVSLLVTDDRHIRKMNFLYRGIDAPTDVLSFALSEKTVDAPNLVFPEEQTGFTSLGEVIISYPRIVEQAAKQGIPVDDEMVLVVVHGMLHLLGYDHKNAVDARKMRHREKTIMTLIKLE